MNWQRITLLVCSLLFVAVATLSPGAYQSSTATPAGFWCFACDPLSGSDAIANTLMFVPLGAALAIAFGRGRALFTGVLLSIGIETLQHFGIPSGRDSNITDVMTNSLGTMFGLQIVRHWHTLIAPSARTARTLSAASASFIVFVLALTAWALGRDVNEQSIGNFERSELPFTPGFGWYHGYVLNTNVRQLDFEHPGDGPLILKGELAAVDTFTVRVARRDERNALVPLLYIHKTNDTLPQLIVGQSGIDARVRIALRAARLRFVVPELILPRAFADSGKEIRTLEVVVRPESWSIQSERSGITASATLPLTLGLGWTFVQGAIRLGGTASAFISIVWMCVLFFPVGFWSAQHGSRLGVVAGSFAFVLATALWVLPSYAGIAPTTLLEWVEAIAGFIAGISCARLTQRRRSAL
ncbi:MAG: VanZ family protein [Gemmatimonadaceae bacterium]